MRPRRILLISPAFHGYWHSIQDALERRGFEVVTHRYDELLGLGAKVRNKIRYELPTLLGNTLTQRRLAEETTARATARLREVAPDLVVMIKGDVLDAEFMNEAAARHLPTTLWLYDEVRRTQHTDETLRAVDRLVTYSRLDAEQLSRRGLDVTYLPNAFDGHAHLNPIPTDELVFIGARYPDRQRQLELLRDHGLPVRAYGRDWSHHWMDRVRTWDPARPGLPAHRDVDRATAYDVMAGSIAALNAHTDQDGFTMRTFEACGAGALQLIDRPDVAEFYDPDEEIVVYGSPDELVDLAWRAVRDRGWARSIGARARARTLAEHTFDHRVRVLEKLWD